MKFLPMTQIAIVPAYKAKFFVLLLNVKPSSSATILRVLQYFVCSRAIVEGHSRVWTIVVFGQSLELSVGDQKIRMETHVKALMSTQRLHRTEPGLKIP